MTPPNNAAAPGMHPSLPATFCLASVGGPSAGEAKAAAVGAGACAARAGVAVRGGLANTFLPAGFPGSVRPEYVRYRCWDILQVRQDVDENSMGGDVS